VPGSPPVSGGESVPTEPDTVGSLLRRFRVRAGLSQEALAERAAISAPAIGALERGLREHPHAHTLRALSTALDLTPGERDALLEAAARRPRVASASVGTSSGVTSPSVRRRLPEPPIPLIGRDAEVQAVTALLLQHVPPVRLVTLVGPGGMGKTRLALALAQNVASSYADGAVFVDLASLRDQRLVPATIAHALEVGEAGGRSARELLIERVGECHMLLVLDNFEQLLGAAPLLAELLASCPNLALLVTSRTVLRLQAEWRFAVEPLAAPAAEADQTLQAIASSPAVRLFVERTQTFASDFSLTLDNAAAIAGVCRHLDGMPLALELAAARVPLLPPDALLWRLERRLPLLTTGARDLPERQQTLRATLAWSYDLLGPAEQMLFQRLAVFAGGWTLEAAEAVCGDSDLAADEVFERLGALLDNSLVQRALETDTEPRFGMLETVRKYAAERLAESGEWATARERHANWCLRLAEHSAPELRGPHQAIWLERLEREHDNLRAALAWARESSDMDLGLRLAGALWPFWQRHSHLAEGRRWLEGFLPATQVESGVSVEVRATALTGAAWLAHDQDDFAAADRHFVEGLTLYRALGQTGRVAEMLAHRAVMARGLGRYDQALELVEESLALASAAGDPAATAFALFRTGVVTRERGRTTGRARHTRTHWPPTARWATAAGPPSPSWD